MIASFVRILWEKLEAVGFDLVASQRGSVDVNSSSAQKFAEPWNWISAKQESKSFVVDDSFDGIGRAVLVYVYAYPLATEGDLVKLSQKLSLYCCSWF